MDFGLTLHCQSGEKIVHELRSPLNPATAKLFTAYMGNNY